MTANTNERASHRFEAVWQVIKGWDLQRNPGEDYAGATGSDVQRILDALSRTEAAPVSATSEAHDFGAWFRANHSTLGGTPSMIAQAAWHAAISAPPQSTRPAEVASEVLPIVLTASQLRNALDFAAPDFDTDEEQRETPVSIAWGEEGRTHDDEGNPDPAGYRVWLTDYPEEGCIPLLDEYPSSIAGLSKQSRPRVAAEAPQEAAQPEVNRLLAIVNDASTEAELAGRPEGERLDKSVYALRKERDEARAALTAQEATQGQALPDGWKLDHVEEREPGIVEIGHRNEDDEFYGVVTVDADNYYQPEEAMPIARAIIAALAQKAQPAQAPTQQIDSRWYISSPACPAEFKEYVARNYSGEVMFSDPAWHAERLWRAACWAAQAPSGAVDETKEREAFEAWTATTQSVRDRSRHGVLYTDARTSGAWLGWIARAQIAATSTKP